MQSDVIVKPLTLSIGAEIEGVDLRQPLSNAQAQAVHDALMQHQVIFFRGQEGLSHEAHKAFGLFGELAIHSGVPGIEGHPGDRRHPRRRRQPVCGGENWHSDLTMNPEPPMGSILYMHTIPPVGGDTCWPRCTRPMRGCRTG